LAGIEALRFPSPADEHVVFSHFSTGAADDLANIADIARSIVTRYAMEPELGHVALETDQRWLLGPGGESLRQELYGDDTAREIDCAADLCPCRRALRPAGSSGLVKRRAVEE
jgi:ATP-dependent Zn protease